MNIGAYSERYSLIKLLFCAVVVILTALALPAMAADKDKPKPSGHGGEGIIQGDKCLKTNSELITEVCVRYKVSWKLWTLMGEPVGDYRLKWELLSYTIKINGNKSVTYNPASNKVALNFGGLMSPPELEKEIKKIELYFDAEADVALGVTNRLGLPKHAFNTGVATHAGETSFNTPESPQWSKLFIKGRSTFGGEYLSEGEAKALFNKSHQPELPLELINLTIGPKSTVTELNALENRINKLCSEPKTASKYYFCPELKEKPKKEKETKKDSIDDAFSELNKDMTTKAGKGIDDGFDGLDNGKGGSTTGADGIKDSFDKLDKKNNKGKSAIGRGIDTGFQDVETKQAEKDFKDAEAKQIRMEEEAKKTDATMEYNCNCRLGENDWGDCRSGITVKYSCTEYINGRYVTTDCGKVHEKTQAEIDAAKAARATKRKTCDEWKAAGPKANSASFLTEIQRQKDSIAASRSAWEEAARKRAAMIEADEAANAEKEEKARRKAEEDAARNEYAKKEAREKTIEAEREEKNRQYCMADRSRLVECICSKYNHAKGNACSK